MRDEAPLRAFDGLPAGLDFRVRLPADWIAHALPSDPPDFSAPATLMPLAIVSAPHSAIVFTAAARPAYDDGNLQAWTLYLLGENNLTPRALGEHTLGHTPAMVGEAVQSSDLGPMLVRFALFEDGGRLVQFSLTAPELLAEPLRNVWLEALASFALADPKGATRPTLDQNPEPQPEPHAEDQPGSAPDSPSLPPPPPAAAPQDGPPWWKRAKALDLADRIAEAEAVIQAAIPHLAFAAATAQLHRERMLRLQEAGDPAGARIAFEQATNWIRSYAAMATSGGEGAALSRERDEFLASLQRAFAAPLRS